MYTVLVTKVDGSCTILCFTAADTLAAFAEAVDQLRVVGETEVLSIEVGGPFPT